MVTLNAGGGVLALVFGLDFAGMGSIFCALTFFGCTDCDMGAIVNLVQQDARGTRAVDVQRCRR